MSFRGVIAAVGATLLASGSAGAERLVVVYENRSSNAGAIDLVALNCFEGVLARKGYEVIDGQEVTDFAVATKLAHVDPLPADVANRITLRFHADGVVAVVIDFALEGRQRPRGPRSNPAIGLSAKLIAIDGREVWRTSMGLLSDTTLVTAGRDERASAVAEAVSSGCEQLLFTFPKGDRTGAAPAVAEEVPPRPRFSLHGAPRVEDNEGRKERPAHKRGLKAAGSPTPP